MALIFDKTSALESAWRQLEKEEAKQLKKRAEKGKSLLTEKLEGKVPEKLRGALDRAFEKAFALVFEKGTAVIEKTYDREKIEKDHKVQRYASALKQDKGSLKTITRKAKQSGTGNLLVSGALGMGMGAVGVGLPDIPVFTGMLLKSIYEIALRYGYGYETEQEQLYILLLIEGALASGEEIEGVDKKINTYIKTGKFEEQLNLQEEIKKVSKCLSEELLYIKFLQGIPLVGVVGGAFDAIYLRQINVYAELKYRRRYLYDEKLRKKVVQRGR